MCLGSVGTCMCKGIIVSGLNGKELHYEWIPDQLSGDTAYAIVNAAPVVLGVPKKCRVVRKAYVYVLSSHSSAHLFPLQCTGMRATSSFCSIKLIFT